jgi:hypothetical protein
MNTERESMFSEAAPITQEAWNKMVIKHMNTRPIILDKDDEIPANYGTDAETDERWVKLNYVAGKISQLEAQLTEANRRGKELAANTVTISREVYDAYVDFTLSHEYEITFGKDDLADLLPVYKQFLEAGK